MIFRCTFKNRIVGELYVYRCAIRSEYCFCFVCFFPSRGDFIDLNESSAENKFEKPYTFTDVQSEVNTVFDIFPSPSSGNFMDLNESGA